MRALVGSWRPIQPPSRGRRRAGSSVRPTLDLARSPPLPLPLGRARHLTGLRRTTPHGLDGLGHHRKGLVASDPSLTV